MKYYSAALLFLATGALYAQQNLPDILVQFENFTVNYSQDFLQPLEVWYEVECPEPGHLKDLGFTKILGDSLESTTSGKKHYEQNEWDQGHMAPSASLDCDLKSKKETYTYLNCALQLDQLNRGLWKQLENRERSLAKDKEVSVYIRIEFKDSLRIEGALVPSGLLKVLSFDGITESYFFPNKTPIFEELDSYRTSSGFWLKN